MKNKLANFIADVYGTLPEGAVPPVWAVARGKSPSFPISFAALASKVQSDKHAFYYGTASVYPLDGRIYNRKDRFAALHCPVLDDIGSKIDVTKLPQAIRENPSYVIETSAGNFQYGYALELPITDYASAALLIQLIYDSGFTDAGGAMPNKLVRLPFGVNGKTGDKGGFRVRLVDTPGYVWQPQDLLSELNVNVDWAKATQDVEAAQRARRRASTSVWSPAPLHAPNLEGEVDPILEWLYENDRVITETDEWITIECPQGDKHSDRSNTTAGYSPVGRGSEESLSRRGFHCFHDACSHFKTPDFLAHIAEQGGPECSVRDEAAHLVAQWIYDRNEDGARHIGTGELVKLTAFRAAFPKRVTVPVAGGGKPKVIAEAALWINAPNRVMVSGSKVDPTTDERLVRKGEQLFYNAFRLPEHVYAASQPDPKHIDTFTRFVDFLCPLEPERDYFLQWLAAKVQKPSHRGCGVVMTTPQSGVGRTTLTTILARLFGAWNVGNVNFGTLTGDGGFNEWQAKLIVTVDESKDGGSGATLYKAYERLKDFIDPRPKQIRLNPKYGKTSDMYTYTSYIMYSNHEDALALDATDRRVYVITNPLERGTVGFYSELNEWIDAGGWEASVWHYLNSLTVDYSYMNSPPPQTAGKDAMLAASRSPVTTAVSAVLDAWDGPFIAPGIVSFAVSQVAGRLDRTIASIRSQVRRELGRQLLKLPNDVSKARWENQEFRFAQIRGRKTMAYGPDTVSMKVNTSTKLSAAVTAALDEAGY